MNDVLAGNFASCRWQFWRPQSIRVVNWNIDRGLRLPEITDFLASQQADVLTLQEVDLNARRTHFRNVAEELARKLQMNYVFGREFEELTQGSRTSPAYHGQATLSRWRLKNGRVIRFRRQSGFWRPQMVFAPNGTLSGAARWAHCLGNGSRRVGDRSCRLQSSLGEPWQQRSSPFPAQRGARRCCQICAARSNSNGGRHEFRRLGRIYGCAYSTNWFPERAPAITFVHQTGPQRTRESTLNRLGVYIRLLKGNTRTGSRDRQRLGSLSDLVHPRVLVTRSSRARKGTCGITAFTARLPFAFAKQSVLTSL